MKLYKVRYFVDITEEVEADNEEQAKIAFAELWSSPQDFSQEGTTQVTYVGESE